MDFVRISLWLPTPDIFSGLHRKMVLGRLPPFTSGLGPIAYAVGSHPSLGPLPAPEPWACPSCLGQVMPATFGVHGRGAQTALPVGPALLSVQCTLTLESRRTLSHVHVLSLFSLFLCTQCRGPSVFSLGVPQHPLSTGDAPSLEMYLFSHFQGTLGERTCLSLEPKPSIWSPPLFSVCSNKSRCGVSACQC